MTVDLTEEFTNPLGEWANYDNYQANDLAVTKAQKHVDVRSFRTSQISPPNVFQLSSHSVGELSGYDNLLGSAGSFETSLAGYGTASSPRVNPGATLTRVSTQAKYGSWSMQVTTTAASALEGADYLGIPVVAHQHYQISAYVKGSVGGESVGLGIGDGTVGFAQAWITATTSWQRIDLPFTPTASGTTGVAIVNGFASVETFFVDAVQVAFSDTQLPVEYSDPWTMARLSDTSPSPLSDENWTSAAPGGSPVLTLGASNLSGFHYALSYSGMGTAAGYSLTSAMPDRPVDLETGFDDDDYFSVALPWFDTDIDKTNTFIDLTSDPNGDFDVAPFVSVAFSTSIVPMGLGLNSEFRVLRSAFNSPNLDLSRITGVRFRLKSTATSTFVVAAIRLLSKDWTYMPLDVDTRSGLLAKTVPLDGSMNGISPKTWPIMWRAAEPAGQDDPRPIDSEMGIVFNTGTYDTVYSTQAANANTFTMYFRELTEDFLTQLDLNNLHQSDLDGHDQPDVGEAMYNTRSQSALEYFNQTQLDNQQQFSLERTPDYLSASWIQFSLQWTSALATIAILDTEGNGYSFPISTGLPTNTTYVFYTTLEENGVRATLYHIDASGKVGDKVFDSGYVRDDSAYKRRKGRFGWHADFNAGDAWIDSIRTRSLTYAEYRSLPYESVTPVMGAELFTSTSPPIELFESFAPGPWNNATSLVERDSQRSLSGSSWKFTNPSQASMQGLQSNSFLLDDFRNSVVKFDLYYPTSAGGDLKAFLTDDTGRRVIDLLLPPLTRDQWQSIKVDLPFDQTEITGRFRILLLQTVTGEGAWWVDNPNIYSRSVAWEGRAVVDDPWMSNDATWTPFYDNMNTDNGGIVFSRRGSQLQVRAKGLRGDSHIDRVQFKPKYAELGRFTYATTDRPTGIVGTPSFNAVSTGSLAVRLTGSASFIGNAYVANYEWNFGDGSVGVGPVVDHTYDATGVYTVTLVVTDNYGERFNFVNTVAV